MFNVVSILTLLKSVTPALIIIAHAFRYGMSKHSGVSWKSQSAKHHVGKATTAIGDWVANPKAYSLLADAGLRLLFALCLSAKITKYVPKEQSVAKESAE